MTIDSLLTLYNHNIYPNHRYKCPSSRCDDRSRSSCHWWWWRDVERPFDIEFAWSVAVILLRGCLIEFHYWSCRNHSRPPIQAPRLFVANKSEEFARLMQQRWPSRLNRCPRCAFLRRIVDVRRLAPRLLLKFCHLPHRDDYNRVSRTLLYRSLQEWDNGRR